MTERQTTHSRYGAIYPVALAYCALLVLLAFLLDTPDTIWQGLGAIVSTKDALITDYFALAGPGAALVNSALVILASLAVLKLANHPLSGNTIAVLGLMAGFSLFGKNIFNIWPLIFGSFLYSRFRKESFSKHAHTGLMSTALAPAVSCICFSGWLLGLPMGLLVGVALGFLAPALASYTVRIQNGVNLYNMGFACGLLALMIAPVLRSMGMELETHGFWATEYTLQMGLFMGGVCAAFIVAGSFFAGRSPREAWADYRDLLRSSGRAPSDFLMTYGPAPTLINIGACGLIGVAYILLIEGDLNGPTLGGILSIMGFAAYGKHSRNITPVIFGVFLGGLVMHFAHQDPATQLAGLFGTTLAPLSGYFGWPFGVLAGFLHSCLVLYTGAPVGGLNLYNNGFSGGLIALVLYPILTTLLPARKEEKDTPSSTGTPK